ncbi:hypothetical protein AXX17_AT1G12640 [Arabidopsis thaliana]|uniref:Thylakoid lumenal protein TL20.3, chloroplastic n=1 Tax=Arabidopsis thaliana TaxID=3702 RepID=A0A178W3D3_ARATH|nr:hypothetical protein AXX17_AT1G12640 [Arabidopsis thaliana]
MAFSSLSPLPMKSLDISRSSSSVSRSPYHFQRYPLRRLQLSSRSNLEIKDSSNTREGCCSSAESNTWKRILSAAMAAAVIASSSGVPAMAELNRFEADTRGEFGIGSAAQYGSADLRRANFTSADMRESDFSGSTFNGAYLEKAVAYKANFSG